MCNPRQRVLAAIQHKQPDRVPVDLGGMRSTGITASAYGQLKKQLGITTGDIHVFDATQQLAYVEEPVRQRFGCDVHILDEGLLQEWHDYTLFNGTQAKVRADARFESDGKGGEYYLDASGRRIAHRSASAYSFNSIFFPLEDAATIGDLDTFDWPVLTDEILTQMESAARQLFTQTEYAILGTFGGAFLEGGQSLRGWSKFMLDLARNRTFAVALLDRLLAIYLRNVELYLEAVGDYIQVIHMGGDLGTQNGPQIHPRMYYEIIQPRQKVLWERIHQLAPGIAVFLHSCGSIYELIPGIIDAGCDVLNPVQISARGMRPERLKKDFGDKLCFWGGGCDTQHVLPFGTPEEVYEHTRQNIEIFKPGGGFVFSQVHNIQPDVPAENILAMFAAVQDSWDY
ncbi:MAG: uroporphyrinogen decarboxylase family protein [Chloroflexota bacterium]